MTVKVHNAGFQYQHAIFENVSFTAHQGETICILGPNGTGKTTLIKCLTGLISCTQGNITITDTTAYVPQNFLPVFAYSVLETVVMGRSRSISPFSVPNAQDYRIATQALAQVGLAHLSTQPVTKLSGGERQLVLIARALATQSQILILDEPTASLDFSNQYKVLGLLHQLSKQHGYTIIFSSHRPEHPLYIADKCLLLYKDYPPQFGPTNQIITSNNLMKLYKMVINVSTSKNQTPHIEGVVPILNIH